MIQNSNCVYNGWGCTRTDRPPILRERDDGFDECGHCGEVLFAHGSHVADMDVTCKGDVIEWWSRSLDVVVHLCGEANTFADSVENALRDSRRVRRRVPLWNRWIKSRW